MSKPWLYWYFQGSLHYLCSNVLSRFKPAPIARCLEGPGFTPRSSKTKDFKLLVEARPIKGYFNAKTAWLIRCQNSLTGRIWLRLRCDISVRHHYKVAIIYPLLQAGTVPIWPESDVNPIQKNICRGSNACLHMSMKSLKRKEIHVRMLLLFALQIICNIYKVWSCSNNTGKLIW